MKKILCAVLSALILVSALCFVSCESEPELMDTINGMSAKDAVKTAMENLKNTEKYSMDVDAELFLIGLSIGKINDFYTNTKYGDDMHYKFTDADLGFINNEQIFSLFSDFDKEVWYVNGTRFSITADGEERIDANNNVRPTDVVSMIIDTISESELNTAQAYSKDDEQYVLMTINVEEYNIGVVTCKIYLNSSNRFTNIILDGNLYGLGATVTINFKYTSYKVSLPKKI